jgi:hypothetical protein
MVEKVDESGLRSEMILELFVAKEKRGDAFRPEHEAGKRRLSSNRISACGM